MKSVKELKNKHVGEDIYILASGKSVDFFNEDFFDDKIVIGVNQAYKKIWCDYLVRKEVKFIKESLATEKVATSFCSLLLLFSAQKINALRAPDLSPISRYALASKYMLFCDKESFPVVSLLKPSMALFHFFCSK